ncbi:MAG: ATP-binding cassette domain-containing protein [Pseudomonadota bacterium]
MSYSSPKKPVPASRKTVVPPENGSRRRQSAAKTRPTDDFTRSSRIPGLWRMFGHVVARHPRTLFFIVIAALLSNALMLLQPLFVMTVYDRVIPHGAFETLWALATGVMVAFLLDLCLRNIRIRLENAVAIKMSIDLQAKLYKRLIHARASDVPDTVSAWTDTFREIERASALVPALLISIVVDVPFIAAVLFVVYSIGGTVVFAPVAGILILAVWTLVGAVMMRRTGSKVARSQAQRTELLTESASLANLMKYTGAQSRLYERFHWLLADTLGPMHRLKRHSDMQMQLTNFMVQGVIVFSVVLGVYKIAEGEMSMGALVATMLLVSRVLMPAGQFVLLVMRANEITLPLTRIFNLFNVPQESAEQTDAERTLERGHLSLTNVGLSYDNGAAPVLSNITLDIAPGEKVAIIGRSGSGKSSLLKLLIRIYDPDEGQYLVDDHNVLQYAPDGLRDGMTYMSQENELFDGSIHDNLMIAAPDADHSHVKEALISSGAYNFVRKNPKGLSQRVGKRGLTLSGGERQSICLARTFLGNPKVLILDEPTSSMDQTMEGQVIAGLKKLGGTKTLILATHRVNVLSAVDRVIWLDEGRIKEDGPASAVLAKLTKQAA